MEFALYGYLVAYGPYLVALVAIIDAVRLRAPWFWFFVIIFFPLIGSIVYFVVTRSSSFGPLNAGPSRRNQARKRLRALQVQLSHWRGPALLVEAGEELLVLGKAGEAERHFREAFENGGTAEDVNLGLAQALQHQRKFAEAVPLLEELLEPDPDVKLGEVRLALARCLDEMGERERAESVLRELLERRSPFEARVRLARLLLARDQRAEAEAILAEVRNDAELLPRYLKRRHRAWIRAARRLKTKDAKLPKPELGLVPQTAASPLLIAAAVAGLVLIVLPIGLTVYRSAWVSAEFAELQAEGERRRERFETLDRDHPWTGGDDLTEVELAETHLARYVTLRSALEPELASALARKNEIARAGREELVERSQWLYFIGAYWDVPSGAEWARAQGEVEEALVEALDASAMGPAELEKLITIIEWRYLERPEAIVFGLPDFYRQDWIETEYVLETYDYLDEPGADVDAEWYRESLALRERSRAKLDDMARKASENLALAPSTRARLEEHRRELERLDPAGLALLLSALDETLYLP